MDDTQTTSPATQEVNAQTPLAGESAPSDRPEASNGQPEAPSGPPGFSERGRMRRRMRFLRKARELAYRDLGGLVFDLHRFGHRNDTLVLTKLETVGRIDTELRALESTLAERRPVTVLREAGVAACPRCAAIHGSDDRFCPNCGLAMDLRAERPMAGPQSAPQAAPAPAPAPAPPAGTPAPAPAMAPTAVHTQAHVTPPPPRTPAAGWPQSPAPAPGGATPAAPTAPTAPAAPATPAAAPMPTPTMPSATAPPVPATATPAPATPAPSTPTPAQGARPPTGPAPSTADDSAVGKDGPGADQPTEIVRPPVKDP